MKGQLAEAFGFDAHRVQTCLKISEVGEVEKPQTRARAQINAGAQGVLNFTKRCVGVIHDIGQGEVMDV